MEREEKDFPIPDKIANYKIEGLLTKGGMSLLYLGTEPHTQEPVLIKVLSEKYVKDQDVSSRFLNEARLIAKANHPNIVKLYDSGSWSGGLYIAMEFVKGVSLKKMFLHQPFSLKRALEILLQIAYALCHLHTHGIVHGDVKPENILINEQGQVKLIDFGIAQVLTEKQNSLAPKRLAGTPIYMSPEQLENWGNVSFQSDIYSLGIIAYELALGKISHGRVIISLAPKGLQKILHKALQPRPDDRYRDIVDFIGDLSNYIKSGAYQQDKQGSDYFLEVFEKLEAFQNTATPATAPSWERVEIGLISRLGLGLSGYYYEFIDLSAHKKAIFLAEAPVKGTEGILFIGGLKVLFRTLQDLYKESDPEQLLSELKTRVQKDLSSDILSFAYIVIDEKTKTAQFFQEGGNTALYCQTGEEIVQIPPHTKTNTLTLHDRLLLVATSQSIPEDVFSETASLSCQTQAETILRKVSLKEQARSDELSIIIMTFQLSLEIN